VHRLTNLCAGSDVWCRVLSIPVSVMHVHAPVRPLQLAGAGVP
jgi:hypothetical protein